LGSVLTLESEPAKHFPFIGSKCHDIFLHSQPSCIDYEENVS
jgi:hypothetical protein